MATHLQTNNAGKGRLLCGKGKIPPHAAQPEKKTGKQQKKITMKHLFSTILLLSISAAMLHAQNTPTNLNLPVGAGIATPTATFHIHQSVAEEPDPGALDPWDRDGADHYRSVFMMSNPNSGVRDTDGFVIVQYDKGITLQQLEGADLNIYGKNGTGLTINKYGRMGIGGSPSGTNRLAVTGNSAFTGSVSVSGTVTAEELQTTDDAEIGGQLIVGSGFRCTTTGQVRAKEVRVTLTGWSDFVFDEGYRLPSLPELERYVKENRHLPDIPSESEVRQGGVDLGEMNALLLQKVEELTLYIIDLQKQIDELRTKKQ